MDLTADIRHEDGMYWAEVGELPGCFASGETARRARSSAGGLTSPAPGSPAGNAINAEVIAIDRTIARQAAQLRVTHRAHEQAP